ncbi:putative 2-5A-dependent ribonuclease [Aspergillus arachidicola]|uniref:Putative 2-5A-dependent ribonuclease n=1 Tax=Aspergillus arachidicola TaxID=656916 RepID=A0A2G7FIH3_9EURO|nr:putative 2-5A-dependent ribonuclease [Aspergillus arachidicola]
MSLISRNADSHFLWLEELEDDVHKFYVRNHLEDVVALELLVKGARIAQEPDNLYTLSLTSAEFKAIKDEKESGFWQQSKDLKVTILTTACAAITQGWQQSTINAGSRGWKYDLQPQGEDWTRQHLLLGGFIDAAPWLSGSIIGDYTGAFVSLRQLRGTDIQAARDLYYIHSQLQVETEMFDGERPQNWYSEEIYQKKVRETGFFKRLGKLFSHPRNQRACVAAFLVMASQQLCGINVLSFYSSQLFGATTQEKTPDTNGSQQPANVVWLNFGFGLANFLFTIPANVPQSACYWFFFRIEIDKVSKVRLALVSAFTIGFFTFFYGIGAGPVPFTFSAEVFPLAFREVGMSFSVMVNFLGLGLLVLFVPQLTKALGQYGESKLCFLFTGLNALAFVLVFLFVPSGTAKVGLEEMNQISVRLSVARGLDATARDLTPNMSRYDDFRIAFNVNMSDEEIDAALTANGLISLHHALNSSSGNHSNDSSHRSSSEVDRHFPRRLTPTEHITPRTIPKLPQSPELEIHRDENGKWDRSDRMIPTYTLAILENDSFLGSPWAEKFQASQYTFCPIDIEEGKSLKFSKEWKLPFVNDISTPIGNGAYGSVTKEIIGSGHFRSRSEHHLPGAPYSKDIAVALKQFEGRGDFRLETTNLDVLRSSLSKHDRIVPFLATVTIGNSFNILSPLADMDLDVFLREGHQECPDVTVRDLMQEAAHLAGALAFLHQGLDSNPPGLSCCHMDLKPGNILVFRGDARDFPKVGKWKISDFGISIMSRPERTGTTVTEFVDSFTQRQRLSPPPGPYQSPDGAGHGLKSDIWSLGCILTRILALGLEGADGMMHLDQLRGTDGDGASPYENDYFHRGSPPVLNPHVQSWLSGLTSGRYNYNQEFLARCQSLILSMLAISHDDRPSARNVQEELHNLVEIAQPIVLRPPSINTSVGGSASVGSGSDNIRVNSRDIQPGNERLLLEIISLWNGDVNIEGIWDGNDRLLIYLIRSDYATALEVLLARQPGLDLETPDSKGDTPLKIAAAAGKRHIVEMLLNAGANIDAPSRRGVTPLMPACRHGHVSTVRLLLDRGADCSNHCEDGYTSLHYAIYSDNGATIIQLLRGKVSFNIRRSHTDETPLLTLIVRYDGTESWWDKFGRLLQGSADINMADIHRSTPLSLAVEQGHSQLAAILLRQGAKYGERPKPRPLSSEMAKVLKNAQLQGRRESQSSSGSSSKSSKTQISLIRRISTLGILK